MKQIEKGSYLDWILGIPVKSWLDGEPDYETSRPMVIPRIYCMDGENVSVQAGEYLYCTPRENCPGWFKVEAGYPSCVPPIEWEKYAERWETPCDTIYAYLPVELVKRFITAHGGEDTKKCFDMLEKQKENGH